MYLYSRVYSILVCTSYQYVSVIPASTSYTCYVLDIQAISLLYIIKLCLTQIQYNFLLSRSFVAKATDGRPLSTLGIEQPDLGINFFDYVLNPVKCKAACIYIQLSKCSTCKLM